MFGFGWCRAVEAIVDCLTLETTHSSRFDGIVSGAGSGSTQSESARRVPLHVCPLARLYVFCDAS